MTMPKDVQDARGELDAAHDQRFAPWRHQWRTIRAHLMSQDAEIERLIQESSQRFIRGREWAELSGRNERRAELAESRLAAANALLREISGRTATGTDFHDLAIRIRAHLQGAGDE